MNVYFLLSAWIHLLNFLPRAPANVDTAMAVNGKPLNIPFVAITHGILSIAIASHGTAMCDAADTYRIVYICWLVGGRDRVGMNCLFR